jgi:hypothetical protein
MIVAQQSSDLSEEAKGMVDLSHLPTLVRTNITISRLILKM